MTDSRSHHSLRTPQVPEYRTYFVASISQSFPCADTLRMPDGTRTVNFRYGVSRTMGWCDRLLWQCCVPGEPVAVLKVPLSVQALAALHLAPLVQVVQCTGDSLDVEFVLIGELRCREGSLGITQRAQNRRANGRTRHTRTLEHAD